jgi:hypothetical protein
VKPLRPPVKVGIVFLGLILALAIAWCAVGVRQLLGNLTDQQTYGGMYAFGDLLLGIAVFGVLALVPLGLAFYWLRPVAWFWSALLWGATVYAATGFVAVAVNHYATTTLGGWLFLANARFGLMPLSALALLACALFAPQARQRWLFLAAALSDGIIFTTVLVVKFFLPRLGAG